MVRCVVLEAAWAPGLVVIAHAILGGLFGHEPFVDPPIHFCGGIAAAYFFRRSAACAKGRLGEPNDLALALLAFGLATVAAVGWEAAEWVVDRVRGSHMQRGVTDTMRDLMLGMAGAAAYAGTRLRTRRAGIDKKS